MSGQGQSTSRHLSPRLTVSAGSQIQRSAYTIYSDVKSDHNVFAFVPPPVVGGAQVEDLDHPLHLLSHLSKKIHSRRLSGFLLLIQTDGTSPPSSGKFARRLDTDSESSGPGTADPRVVAQEDGLGDRPVTFRFGGGRGHTDSGVFNFVVPADGICSRPVRRSCQMMCLPRVPTEIAREGRKTV